MYYAKVSPAIMIYTADGDQVIYYREDYALRDLQVLLQYDGDDWVLEDFMEWM